MSDKMMDRNYRGPRVIGNWRRRQARQERRRREAVLRAKQAYAKFATEYIKAMPSPLAAMKKFGEAQAKMPPVLGPHRFTMEGFDPRRDSR